MLSALTFIQVFGERLTFAPAQRFNLLTGDNGLGKTLVLDTVWWALTNTWAGRPVRPRQGHASEGYINFSQTEVPDTNCACRFNTRAWKWVRPGRRPDNQSLVLYFRADGSAAVFDPARNVGTSDGDLAQRVVESHQGEGYALHNVTLDELPDQSDALPAYRFRESRDVLEGLNNGSAGPCNGMIADWVLWQHKKAPEFDSFQRMLKTLYAELSEGVEVAEPVRIAPTDAREYPAVRFGTEVVPLIYASAGMLRVAAVVYLAVWAWHEHLSASELQGLEPAKELVVLWDEVEAHLHPRWQRSILPSFRAALAQLTGGRLSVQFLLATHSPLVAASLEPMLVPHQDKLFRFGLCNGVPEIEEQTLEKRGAADVWLEELFELKQPGSLEREEALEEATAAMRSEPTERGQLDKIQAQLSSALPDSDPFWVDWKLFRRGAA